MSMTKVKNIVIVAEGEEEELIYRFLIVVLSDIEIKIALWTLDFSLWRY